MKTIFRISTILLCLSVFSCKDRIEYTDYINLSRVSYTFDAKGSDTISIKVSAGSEWSVQNDNDWIFLLDRVEDSVKIAVSENGVEGMRNGILTFRSGDAVSELSISQLPLHFEGIMIDFPPAAKGAVSPNGKYAAYMNTEMDLVTGEYRYYGLKINLETGETEEIASELYDGYQAYDEVMAISDDGRTMIYAHTMNVTYALFRDGEKVELTMPDGYFTIYLAALSADGQTVVGNLLSSTDYKAYPAIWRNGEVEILEIPEVSAGNYELQQGVYVRGCSADASVIYGSEWDMQGLIYYKDGKMFYPGLDYAEGEYPAVDRIFKYAAYFSISPGGRYIGAAYGNYIQDPSLPKLTYPVVVDTETNTCKIFETEEVIDADALTVNDEGVVFGGSPSTGMVYGYVFDMDNGTYTDISSWMKEKEGVEISDKLLIQYNVGNVYYGMKMLATGVGSSYPQFVLVAKR